METPIEIIRRAAILANPEIMELKTGCQVMLGDWDNGVVVAECSLCRRHKTYKGCQNYEGLDDCEYDNGVNIAFISDEGYFTVDKKIVDIASYNIFGRPIRLSDVLLAMQKMTDTKDPPEKGSWAILSDGRIIYCTGEINELYFGFARDAENRDIIYNLRASLEDQTPETLQFLATLLTNK